MVKGSRTFMFNAIQLFKMMKSKIQMDLKQKKKNKDFFSCRSNHFHGQMPKAIERHEKERLILVYEEIKMVKLLLI